MPVIRPPARFDATHSGAVGALSFVLNFLHCRAAHAAFGFGRFGKSLKKQA